MADISQQFERFRTNLEITALQQATVSTRQTVIREAVSNRLNVLDTFLTGSYVRQTMIAPLATADVDIFTVLNSQYFEASGQAKLLNLTKGALQERYPNTARISANGQAVTVPFSDFTVDVVPAFHRQGGGYLIADTIAGKWISTNPKVHIEYKTGQNQIHNGKLVPLIKMIKCWNRHNGSPFKSFYLEMLVAKVLTNIRIDSYPSAARFFFDMGYEKVKYTITDPAGFGDEISGFNRGTTIASAQALMMQNYQRAIEAERFAAAGYVISAAETWQLIFGPTFPVYL